MFSIQINSWVASGHPLIPGRWSRGVYSVWCAPTQKAAHSLARALVRGEFNRFPALAPRHGERFLVSVVRVRTTHVVRRRARWVVGEVTA